MRQQLRIDTRAFPQPRASDMAALKRQREQQQHDAAVLDRWVRRLRERDAAWLKKHQAQILGLRHFKLLGMGPLEPEA